MMGIDLYDICYLIASVLLMWWAYMHGKLTLKYDFDDNSKVALAAILFAGSFIALIYNAVNVIRMIF